MASSKLTPFKPLAKPINNQANKPSNLGQSSLGVTSGSFRAQQIQSAKGIGETSDTSLFSTNSQQKIKSSNVFGVGQNTKSIATSFTQPQISQADNFLKQIESTTERSSSNSLSQPKSSTEAYSVGGQKTRHEQIAEDEKFIFSKKQPTVADSLSQKQSQVETEIGQKQSNLYNSGNITSKSAEQNNNDSSLVELPYINSPKAIDYKLESVDAIEIGQSVVDNSIIGVGEMTTSRIASALKVKRPIIDGKACDLDDSKVNFLVPEDNIHAYEFYIQVDPSKDKEVFDYIFKYRDKIDAKRWFSFYIGGAGYTQSPSWVSLNYDVPPTRFSIDKALYFYVKIKSGKAIETVKNLYFYDTTAKTNTPDAKPFVLKGIKVFYKQEKSVVYYSQAAYEKTFAGDQSVGNREGSAAAYEGTLSENPVVTAEQNVAAEAKKIASEINAGRVVNLKENQDVIAIGKLTGKESAEELGATNKGAIGIGGVHNATTSVGGKHQFHIDNLNSQKISSSSLVGTIGTGALSVGAAAIGASSQGVQMVGGLATRSAQEAINSNIGGFQQMGSFGTSRLPGSNNILEFKRGISSPQSLVLAGSGYDDGVLLFAQPPDQELFGQFRSPIFANTLPDGSLNPIQPIATRSSLDAVRGGSSFGSLGNLRSAGGKYSPSNRKFGSGLSGVNGNGGGNKPPRKTRLGGLGDLPDKPEDGDEDLNDETNSDNFNDFNNLEKLGLGFGTSNLNGEDEFQLDNEPQNPEEQIYENGLSTIRDRPKTGGRIRVDQDEDGKNSFKNLPQRINAQRLSDIKNNQVAKARQGQNAFGEKYKRETLDNLKGKVVNKALDELKKKLAAQAVTFLAGLFTNPITWMVIGGILLALIFVGGIIAAECKPEGELKKFRDTIVEPGITGALIALNPTNVVGNVTTVVQTGANVLNPGIWLNVLQGKSAELVPPTVVRKAIEALPGCEDPSTKCAGSDAGDNSTGAGNNASIECFKKQLEGKTDTDKVTLWKAQGGVSQSKDMSVGTAKEILSYIGKEGITANTAIWVISLATTESGGGNWNLQGGVDNACYGIIQFCTTERGSNTYQDFTKNALGSTPDIETFRKDKLAQMKTANYAFKEKVRIWKNDSRFNGKSDVFIAAAGWLGVPKGCDNTFKNGTILSGICSDKSVYTGDYGDAADRNFKIITCDGGVTASLLTLRQQDQANKYWSEAFGFPVLAKLGEKIKSPVLTGLEVLDARILAFNKVMGGTISVEAFTTTGPVLDEEKDNVVSEPLKKAIESGSLQVALSSKERFLEDVASGLDPLTVKFLVDYAGPKGGVVTALSTKTHRYKVGDVESGAISKHSYGRAVDLNLSSSEDAKKLVEIVKAAEAGGMQFGFFGADSTSQSLMKAAGFAKSMGIDGPGHLHIELGGGSSGLSSTTSNGCPCPSSDSSGSGSIGTSSGPGTVSTGGVFTPEVRAFLDTIANWEAEGADKLGAASYNSGNYKANYFDATKYATSYPTIDSPGNGGRYQVKPEGDRPEANTFLSKKGLDIVKGFDPKNQDLFAVGRWYYRASIKGESKSIQEVLTADFGSAAGIASGEWASAPVISGYKHADTRQSKADLATYKAYYEKRLAIYKSSGTTTATPTPSETEPKKPTYFDFSSFLGTLKVNAAGAPSSYSAISAEHLKLLDEVAAELKIAKVVDGKGDKPEMKEGFEKLKTDAAGKGFDLVLKSGYRSNDTQVTTFFTNGESDKIKEYYTDGMSATDRARVKAGYVKRGESSFPPGYSEHNSGLAIDITDSKRPVSDKLNRDNYPEDLAKYLADNAPKFGFSLSYPKNSGGAAGGAKYEPWHWYFGIKATSITPQSSTAGSSECKCPDGSSASGIATKDLGTDSKLSSTISSSSIKKEITTNVPEAPKPTTFLNFPNIFSSIKASATTVEEVITEGKKLGYTEELELSASQESALVSIGGEQSSRLISEAATKYKEMQAAAKKEGIEIFSKSAFRNVSDQTGIIKDKIADGKSVATILDASAPPGYSQHQTGRAVDILSPGKDLTKESFGPTPAFKWLQANAIKYGFSLSYPESNTAGAKYEPWHWFYFKDYPNYDQTTGKRLGGPKAVGAKSGSSGSDTKCANSSSGTSADAGFVDIANKIATVYNRKCGSEIDSEKIVGKAGASWPTPNIRGNGTGCCYAAVKAALIINNFANPQSPWGKAWVNMKTAVNNHPIAAVDFHTAMQEKAPSGKKVYEEAGLNFTTDAKAAPIGSIVVVNDVSPPYGDINIKVADGKFVNYAEMTFMANKTTVLGVYSPK